MAIERANEMKQGNVVPDNLKMLWLTELDHIIYDEVIKTHLHKIPLREGDYSEWWYWDDEEKKWKFRDAPEYTERNTDEEMIAEPPEDMIYVYWLMAKIDLYSQELNKYNNDYAIFENSYQRFKNKYHRNHHTVPLPHIKVGVFR